MTRLRLPLRLARREVLRRPGRTALVALLVAIPVTGMALAVTLVRSEAETPLEDWQQEYGRADAIAYDGGSPLELPDGARTTSYPETFARLKDEQGHRGEGEITNLPLDDPITDGIYQLVKGRAATADGEAVLSTALADRMGAHPGDTLVLERPALELKVVGEVERTTCLRCDAVLLHTDLNTIPALADPYGGTLPEAVLIDLPAQLTGQEKNALQVANGSVLLFREDAVSGDFEEVDDDAAVRWTLVLGAVVLMVVAIVISAAFAVGARRQLVTLGQLSASGASPSTIRASLVLQGTVTGLVGSVLGLLLAGVVLLVFEDRIEWILDQRLRGYDVRPLELLAVLLIGTAAATASALVPARTAARIPTLAALAGRRPLAPVSRRLVTWGLVGVAVGLGLLFLAVLGSVGGDNDVWAYVAILGGALELLGACALAPAVVATLEPLSARLRGALRLGARTLARHRARTGAVVSAVTAAGALAVVAAALVLGGEEQQGVDSKIPDDVVLATVERYDAFGQLVVGDPPPPELARVLGEAFPTARMAELRGVGFDTNDRYMAWEATEDVAEVYVGAERAYIADEAVLDAIRADDEIRSGLRDHGAVLLYPEVDGREVRLVAPNLREVSARLVEHPYRLGYGAILVTPELAREVGAAVGPVGTIVQLAAPLDDEARDDLEDLSYDVDSVFSGDIEAEAYAQLEWQLDDGGPTALQLELLLTAVALLFCLFVVGVSLALAAAEGKDERDILTIAGAPPATVARSAGARAWLMATLGAALAVPIGFLPVVVVGWASREDEYSGSDGFPVIFPSRTVALLLVVVPLAVCVVAWATSATAQRLRPVRISTATFE